MTGNCIFHIAFCLLQNSALASTNCTLEDGHFYTTKPVANFTYSPFTPTINTEVNFDASESYCPDGGTISSYQWDFNDGNNGTGPTVSHIYRSPGNFIVNLTVTDGKSLLTWSMNETLSVYPGQVSITNIEPDVLKFNSTLNLYETAWTLPINMTVTNLGNTTVTFNVTVLFGIYNVAEQLVTDLQQGENMSLSLTCYITGTVPGDYPISAYPSCTNPQWTGPMCTNGTVGVHLAGDLNGDNLTDIFDAVLFAKAFGSKPGDPNWNPIVDLGCEGIVDIFDAVIFAGNYGRHYP
jgi:PKD repeat protein